ncbi:MAG: YceI family protein [Gemmatimonadetes bacterium]|nr:YceI family protein [Gemmatimonadota bacterium]
MIDIRVAATLAAVAVAAFGAEAAGTSSRHGQIISTAVPGSTDSTRLVLASEGNEARYRVRERIARLEFPSDAVGATNDLTGALVLDEYGKVVAAESKFVVDLRTLKSGRDRRDRYLQRRTLETELYPTIELVLTALPGLLFPLPESGAFSFELVGDMTLHGVTRRIGWHVAAEAKDGGFYGMATTSFTFDMFELTQPRMAMLLSVADTIRLEYDFRLIPDRSSGS